MSRPAALPLLLLSLVLAGCGGSDTPTVAAPAATPAATPAAAAACSPAPPTAPPPAGATTDLKTKPVITPPTGPAPCQLQISDIVVGTGPVATPGKTISVRYVGVFYAGGKEFDSSWSRGAEPFTFPLGGGQVIPGWDTGFAGMKVGGRRQLTIPPDLAYGARDYNGIPGGSTLVFVVDLVSVG